MRHLLKNVDDECEGKTIQMPVIFKNLKCVIIKTIVWLFERHKPSPKPNTIILINFIAVISGKHSEHDTEPACFVICTLLVPLRHRKLRCTALSAGTRSTDAMCVRFILWIFCIGFPVNVVTTPPVSLNRMFVTCSYRNSAVFRGQVAVSSCTVQI